ncbi:MAG: hypothetical protein OEZ34_16730, partial [Spirochaetia bacterium]|nr:hypothetical protein [Spirochaetia bacterium]
MIFLFQCSSEKEKQELPEGLETGAVYRIEIRDAITPATMEILESAIRTAEENQASALLVLLDTP